MTAATLIRPLLAAAALAAATLASAASPPAPVAPFTATYEVRRNGDALGEATLTLSKSGSDWIFSSETRGTAGLARIAGIRIDESSRFVYAAGRPETRAYDFRQDSSLNRRERGAVVDPAAGVIRLRDRDTRTDAPYAAGVIDRQLVTVALMQAAAAGRSGPQRFQVIGRRAVEAQVWRIGAREAVPGSPGAQGLRIERVRDTPDGRSTLMWLDANAGHVPLRIVQKEDDGETVEMRLLSRR